MAINTLTVVSNDAEASSSCADGLAVPGPEGLQLQSDLGKSDSERGVRREQVLITLP